MFFFFFSFVIWASHDNFILWEGVYWFRECYNNPSLKWDEDKWLTFSFFSLSLGQLAFVLSSKEKKEKVKYSDAVGIVEEDLDVDMVMFVTIGDDGSLDI